MNDEMNLTLFDAELLQEQRSKTLQNSTMRCLIQRTAILSRGKEYEISHTLGQSQ